MAKANSLTTRKKTVRKKTTIKRGATNKKLVAENKFLHAKNEMLQEAYDFSRAVADTVHEKIIILDKDLRIKSANKSFYSTFRATKEETEGKLLYELGNRQWDIPRLRELLGKVLLQNSHFEDYEITASFPVIGPTTFLLNARRIVQRIQSEDLILLALTDITERTYERKAKTKELEDIISRRTAALQHSYKVYEDKNIALEKMNKELETFMYVSSHDLQEPLRKIKNFANVLLTEEKSRLSDDGKYYLKRMEDTVVRMQTLINDLLAYSRVKTGQREFEKVNLTEIAKEAIADFKDSIKEKRAIVKTHDLCSANVIRFQFRQLINNLIGNSLKFSHQRRPLRITIKSETQPGSELGNHNLLPNLHYCHLTVIDNGIGFEPQYKERIFEVFQRLHEYEDYKGTGMGLAICKRIVENHNGVITGDGELNKGARFDIYIPA